MSFFITKHICYFSHSTFITSKVYPQATNKSSLFCHFLKITIILNKVTNKKGPADNSTVPISHIPTFQTSIPTRTKTSLFNRLFLKLAISTSKHKTLVLSGNWANITSVFLIFPPHTPHGKLLETFQPLIVYREKTHLIKTKLEIHQIRFKIACFNLFI